MMARCAGRGAQHDPKQMFFSGQITPRHTIAMEVLAVIKQVQFKHRHLRLAALRDDGLISHRQQSAMLNFLGGEFDDVALRIRIEALEARVKDLPIAPADGTVAIMVYPAYAPPMSTAPNELFNRHRDMFRGAVEFVNRTFPADAAATSIACLARDRAFAHVALCGHGDRGALVMSDRTLLTPRAIADALVLRGFRGRLLLTMCMCDANPAPTAGASGAWPGCTPFDATVISVAPGKVVNANADHFARALRVFVERGEQDECAEAAQTALDRAWKSQADRNLPDRDWIPSPAVTSHARGVRGGTMSVVDFLVEFSGPPIVADAAYECAVARWERRHGSPPRTES